MMDNKLIKNLVNKLKASMSEAERILNKNEKTLSDMYFLKVFCKNFISFGQITQKMSDKELEQNKIKERVSEEMIQGFKKQLILAEAYIAFC